MKYMTIYSTSDKNEVSVLKSVFDDENIDFKILEHKRTELESSNALPEQRFQVAEKDKIRAKELLEQTGFLRVGHPHLHPPRRVAGRKWIFFFLAALVLVLVAMLIVWFMNPPS